MPDLIPEILRLVALLAGVAVLLLAGALLGPPGWDNLMPTLRRELNMRPLQLAITIAVALLGSLVIGACTRIATQEDGRNPALRPWWRSAMVWRAIVATCWQPGGLIVAVALAALGEGFLLAHQNPVGVACYLAAVAVACLQARSHEAAESPQHGTLARRYEILLAVLILTGGAFLRLVLIGTYPFGFEDDEIKLNASIVHYMAGEPDAWPASLDFAIGPLPFLYIPLFFKLFGVSVVGARIGVALLSATANTVFYFLARRMLGVPSALIATLLISVSIADLAASRDAHHEAQVKLW
ncbi:MAG: hypothetical protein QOF51_1403, partial [Chloroflexota bacterium]|nr:hypothetical protein [Chloroflexota bacterium]